MTLGARVGTGPWRCYGATMAAPRVPTGGDCVVAAFPDVDTAGLAAAARAITTSAGSTVGIALTDALDPRHWQQSRSAIGGLRRLGVAALAGAPALAGWVRLCAPRAVSAEEQYTVNEGLLALAELRRQAGTVLPPEAIGVVAGFLDTTFEATLTALLAPPLRIWHRGALMYLRDLHGDPECLLPALHSFLTALDGPHDDGPDAAWHEHTRMELVAVIADLGPRLERLRVERSWRAAAPADPGPVVTAPENLAEWLTGELAVPSIIRRRAACAALATLGPQAVAALPAVLRLLAELDAAPDAVVGELRAQALAAAMAMSAADPWNR